MSHLGSLIRRNMKIFYRTKGNIIFASLSVIILVALHFMIFRNMYTDSWVEITAQFPGLVIERSQLVWVVDNLMFSAIIPIGAVSISLVALGLMVSDKETNVLSDFMVAPIRRNVLLASYLISSLLVGFMILLAFLAFFGIFFFVVYGVGFTLPQFGLILLATLGSLVFSNVFMLLIITFVKSQQSLGAIGTILGTLMGFISGAYIPVGMFGKVVSDILNALPFLQITVLVRQAFLYNLEAVTPLTHEMISGEIARSFGMEVWLGGTQVSLWAAALTSGAVTLVLLLCLIVRFVRIRKSD